MANVPLSERKIKIVPADISENLNQYEEKRLLRTVAYCRVSTDSKKQETSFDSQILYYTNLIKQNENWEFVGIYADPAVSGTSRRNRLEFDKMLYDCIHGKIDQIITKSMSRFARNQLDTLAVIRLLNSLHPPVKVLFEDDKVNSDDLSAEIIITICSMLAEQESAKKSISVKWGLERQIEQGNYLTPTKFLLGYDKTQAIKKSEREMFIVEDEAQTVRVIYIMFLAGYKVSEIAYELTKAGVKTGKGNTVWNSSSVLGILKNERYCGDVRTNKSFVENYRQHRTVKNTGQKQYVYETDHHPAIVSHDEYEMAQKLIASHKFGYDPFVNGTYTLTLIEKGLLKGFIPINVHWAGSTLNEYIELSKTVDQTSLLVSKGKHIPFYPGFQVVRRQDISPVGRVAMRITPSSITLSSVSLPMIKGDYVEILFNPIEKLIAIRACDKLQAGAVKWKKQKDGKTMPSSIACSAFANIIYELMNWPKLWNTTVLAAVYTRSGKTVFIFDLTEFEINALPYKKSKKKKEMHKNDVYYDVEAMIAQQLELLHNKQVGELIFKEVKSEEELPPPKRRKLYPKRWAYSFGQDSLKVAVKCRRFHFMALNEWNITAKAVPVEGFNKAVTISEEELQSNIANLYKSSDANKIKQIGKG